MAPAQEAGLTIGDKIIVTKAGHAFARVGDILAFEHDDESYCPKFHNERLNDYIFFPVDGQEDTGYEKIGDRK